MELRMIGSLWEIKFSSVLDDPEWTAALKKEIVTPLVDAATNKTHDLAEAKHWASFYKFESHSGGYNVDGWCKLLFPFRLTAQSYYDNTQRTWKKMTVSEMTNTVRNFCAFMPGFSTVPMTWKYSHDGGLTSKNYDMRLLAGQVGVAQREDGYIQPIWGWGVYHTS